MFWNQHSYSTPSPVESILDKERFTLEDLLDEEEIIQECKALNTRLINFLKDRTQVEQLLRYIVEDAPADAESKRAFKFPFIACEIFTCEIDAILMTLVGDEELMDLLFSFMEPNRTHSSVLAGYFSKVVVCLMLRKTTSLMKYVQTHGDIFHHLIDLIGITSIMEILIRLVGADDHMYPNFLDVMQWLADSNILEMIVDKLNPSSSPEVHANVAEVLWAIIRNAPSALATKLARPSFISRIFSHALEDSPSKSALVHSLSVCITLLDPKRSASTALVYSNRSQQFEPSIPVDPDIINAMLPQLGDLLKHLDVSSDMNVLPTTYGELRPPLGKHRIKIVEFIAVLLGTGNDNSEKELISFGAIQRILDLFFMYPFNNFLHHHVESIILSCLESKNIAIVDHIFCDCNIIGKLLQADKNSLLSVDSHLLTLPDARKQPPRVGYIGHITRIANKLVQLASCNDHIQTYLQENTEWIDWQNNVLHQRNTVENVNRWACGRPTTLQDRTRDSDEDELQDRDYDVTALADKINQAFRYSVYENDEADEDVYFDDESAEVVISSLRLGDDHESSSSLFTNSNWFAFQEDRDSKDPLSTSTLNRMEDINLNGTASSDDESDDVVVGADEELVITMISQNGVSSENDSNPLDGTSEDEPMNQRPRDSKNPSALEDGSSFRFETGGNNDLFNDQQLPDWVGWREPSDIHLAECTDNLTPPSGPVNPAASPLPNCITKDLTNGSSLGTNSSELIPKSEGVASPSSLGQDGEFAGVAAGGVNGELCSVSETTQEMQKQPGGDDGPEMPEFSDKHRWRAELEFGVVQE